eukprot:CAMPEP_0116132976 /NCGR_PEP_ID=MMETSP0329-20121206/9851_1 /TAXON_ID=697910 /ORGANISM="Pseudo-nitzschia arenysensis, Strain B593" /LENGTH=383 /DNA_ID=CAMNT_0003627559 /DNA_START=75 /DNA_END=1229 /DNA_ORIENTATION=+
MSQYQQQSHQEALPTLDFENLMLTQRRLLKDMAPSSAKAKTVAATKIDEPKEEEWISNWQFERIVSDKKPQAVTKPANMKAKSNAPVVDNEGGVYYFQRIQPSSNVPAISSNPSVISTSDTDNAVNSQVAGGNQKHGFDQHDFFLDMTIDNDDLFADLEAAADSNDDSEISLDDLMDMEVEDEQMSDHNDKYMHSMSTSQASGLDFLNKSDFEMMTNDDNNNGYSFSSPITSKDTMSSSMAFGGMPNASSPTSVAQHHMAPPAPPLMPSSAAMSSASTRPALQQMREMMTKLMDNGTMPRARHNSRLPCAEGMDEMYLDTLRKLSASMERSKKTRTSLSIPMQTNMQSNAHYSRSLCVNQILQSVQTSSRHVDTCLRSVSMMS